MRKIAIELNNVNNIKHCGKCEHIVDIWGEKIGCELFDIGLEYDDERELLRCKKCKQAEKEYNKGDK